ncbi:MAG: hypothetical protein J5I93_11490 [Pirellulaceae bacterium]|nr:hypothetical protein [Pirellulaceae bacterium]
MNMPNLPLRRLCRLWRKPSQRTGGTIGQPLPESAAGLPGRAEDRPWNRWLAGWLLRRFPAWLSSILLHLAVVGLLAWWSISGSQPAPAPLLVQVVTAETLDELPELTITAPPTELTLAEPAVMSTQAVEATSLTVDLAAVSADVGISAAEPRGSTADEIRELVRRQNETAGSATAQAGTAEFCGVQATGQRFVFVVDSSRSMRGKRFAAACFELVRSIRQLQPRQAFHVILFDQHPERMRLPPDDEPPPRPVKATPEHVRRFETWLATVELEQGADPRLALEWALAMWPDAIFLLSDGQFNAATEDYLLERNRRDDPERGVVPKVAVHTVGFFSREGEQRLQRIAAQHGGTYRFFGP